MTETTDPSRDWVEGHAALLHSLATALLRDPGRADDAVQDAWVAAIERPGRNEPRRVKRRPKCTRWLQRPRHEYFEHFRSDEPVSKILDTPA